MENQIKTSLCQILAIVLLFIYFFNSVTSLLIGLLFKLNAAS